MTLIEFENVYRTYLNDKSIDPLLYGIYDKEKHEVTINTDFVFHMFTVYGLIPDNLMNLLKDMVDKKEKVFFPLLVKI